MKVFWERGYSATSLPDLLNSMGIARSSFYASFGTKRSVFIECLDLFAQRTLDDLNERVQGMRACELPRAFFESTILEVSHRRCSHGCMMVNTVLELADVDPELNTLAAGKLDIIENMFIDVFRAGQIDGSVSTAHTPEELAGLVMIMNLGLRVQCRQNKSRAELQNAIDSSLFILGLTP